MRNLNNFIYERLRLNKQTKLYNELLTLISNIFSYEHSDSVQLLQDDIEKWMHDFNVENGNIYMYERTWNFILQHSKNLDKDHYIIGRDEFERTVAKYEDELKTEQDRIGKKYIVLYGPNAFYFEYLTGPRYKDLHSFLIVKK